MTAFDSGGAPALDTGLNGSEPRWLLPAAVVVLLAFGLVLNTRWGHTAFEPKNDACLYVLTARSLAEGDGYRFLGEPFTLRPPGFSALITPWIGADGKADFAGMLSAVRLSGLLCAAVLMLFLRRRIGTLLALGVACAVLANRGFQTLSNQVMSDVPGLLLMLACLGAERYARGRRAASAALGLAIGLGGLVRSAVLFAAPAIIVARVLERVWPVRTLDPSARRDPGWIATLLLLAGAVGASLPWSLHSGANAGAGAADQTFMHSYSTAMWHVDAGDPNSAAVGFDGLVERARVRSGEVLAGLGSRITRGDEADEEGRGRDIALGVVFSVASAIVLLRRRAPAQILFFGYEAVLLVYFGFRVRLCLPLYVLGFAASIECLREVWRVPGLRRIGRKGAAALAWAALLLTAALDAGPAPDQAAIAEGAREAEAVAQWITANVPPASVVAATQGFELGVYLPDRPVYGLQRAFRRDGPAGLERVLVREQVDICAIDRRDVLARPIGLALRGAQPLIELGDWVVLDLRG